MTLGGDKQYDVSWIEQDKIRRRLELKNRIKYEGIKKKFDPFLMMKKVHFTDPAVDRYMDLRKVGRLPGSPIRPSLFFGMVAFTFVPIGLVTYLIHLERRDWLIDCANGDYPLEKRQGKHIY